MTGYDFIIRFPNFLWNFLEFYCVIDPALLVTASLAPESKPCFRRLKLA